MNDPTDLYAHVCAELEIVKIERDDAIRDRDALLKSLTAIHEKLSTTIPPLLADAKRAMIGV